MLLFFLITTLVYVQVPVNIISLKIVQLIPRDFWTISDGSIVSWGYIKSCKIVSNACEYWIIPTTDISFSQADELKVKCKNIVIMW